MVNKQKVQDVIKNLLDHEALFPYEQHDSSAQQFDSKLRKRGFKPTIDVCHTYNFPKGYNEESFEKYIFQQAYIYLFDPERVTDTEKYVQKFYAGMDTKVPEHIQKQYLVDLLKFTGELSAEEKACVADYFMTEQPKAFPRMVAFWSEIKTLNPEIADINPQTPFDFYNLYIGMTSRFHPEDIKYFCSITDFEDADKNNNKIEAVLGFGPGFRIAPHRVQQLIDEFIVKKPYKK